MKHWLILSAVLLGLLSPAAAFWQSRDSNYNVAISAGATYTGPGDVVSGAKAWFGLRAYSAADLGNRLINVCDPTNTTCADWNSSATTGALVPTTNPLNGTDCTVSTTCTIKTFYDRSGALNCTAAVCDVTQATAADRATLNWSCINSKPCAVFGTNANYASAASFTSISQPYTASAVASRTGNFTTSQIIISSNNEGQLAFRQVANTVQMFSGSTGQTVANISDSNFHAFEGTFNGASSILFCVGSAGTACSTSGVANSINPGPTAVGGGTIVIGVSGVAYSMNINEMGYWALDFTLSSRQSSMGANQFSYWGPF